MRVLDRKAILEITRVVMAEDAMCLYEPNHDEHRYGLYNEDIKAKYTAFMTELYEEGKAVLPIT